VIRVEIPGRDTLELEHLVFDVNGTLVVGGRIVPGIPEMLAALSGRIHAVAVTADARGMAVQLTDLLGIEVHVIPTGDEARSKLEFIEGLDPAGCIAIGYPIAYFVARRAGRTRGLVLALLVLPFWISYLMRMLAWTNLLQPDGYVNRVLGWVGIFDQPRNWLDGDWPTVVIGLVYGYVPFFILPLYSSLERIDQRLIEAGRDLGASAMRTFRAVTLPLSIPGLLAASVITILPMCGDYYTNSYLSSGSPRTEMVGNQIVFYLQESSSPQNGAALVLVLMAFLVVLMVYYLVSTVRQQKAADR